MRFMTRSIDRVDVMESAKTKRSDGEMNDLPLPKREDIHLIACDVDGTLLTDRCEIHPKNMEVITRIRRDYPDLPIILATGRELDSSQYIREALKIENSPSINSHGAKIYTGEGKSLLSASFSPEISINMIEYFKKEDRFFACDLENEQMILNKGAEKDYNFWTTRYGSKELKTYCKQPKTEAVYDQSKIRDHTLNVSRLLIPVYSYQLDPTIRALNEIGGDEISITQALPWALEVLPAHYNKGKALEVLCKELKIDIKNTLVFGDAMNDVEILSMAGYSVAMMNAPGYIKEFAKYVTKSNEEGGVGYFIEKIFYPS